MKAAKLSGAERQHVLTLTRNATHFELIKRALRTLFSEEDTAASFTRGQRNVWWTNDEWSPEVFASHVDDDGEAYFDEWTNYDYDGSWDDGWSGHEAYWYGDAEWYEEDGASSAHPSNDDSTTLEDIPDELRSQFQEAFALSQEANKTLAQAKAAVAKVRASRGYYAPESSSGKGMSPSSMKGGGPCIICGKPDHHTSKCPDRFSGSPSSGKGKGYGGKSKGKGYGGKPSGKKGKGKKGKFKSKGKGKGGYYITDGEFGDYSYNYFINIPQVDVYVLSLENQEVSWNAPQKALVDTGATENVAGVASMSRLLDTKLFEYQVVMGDRPTFRFGNGLCLRATSRVDLTTAALGTLKVYVLDGTGEQTPLLLGARDLHDRRANLDYETLFMAWRDDLDRDWGCALQRLNSGHLAVELSRKPVRYRRMKPPSMEDQDRDEDDDDFGDGEGDDDDDRPPRKRVVRRFEPNERAVRSRPHPLRPPHRPSPTSERETPGEKIKDENENGFVRSMSPTPEYAPSLPEEEPALCGLATKDFDVAKGASVYPADVVVDGFHHEEELFPCYSQPPRPDVDDEGLTGSLGETVFVMTSGGMDHGGLQPREALEHVENLRGRVALLAQKIQSYQDGSPIFSSSSSSYLGPEAVRLAMLGQASREATLQSTCVLDDVRSGTRPTSVGYGDRRAAADLHGVPDQREDHAGQDHGGAGQSYGVDRSRTIDHEHQSFGANGKGFDEEPTGSNSSSINIGTPNTFSNSDVDGKPITGLWLSQRGGDRRVMATGAGRDGIAAGGFQEPPTCSESEGQGQGCSLPGGMMAKVGAMWQSLKKLRSGIRSTWDCLEASQSGSHDNNTSTTIGTTNDDALHEPRHKAERSSQPMKPSDGRDCRAGGELGRDCRDGGELGGYLRERGAGRTLAPHVAKKLAFSAALIGSAIMQPVNEMFQAMSPQLDVMEIACSPHSSLTSAFEDAGFNCQRINYKTGFDLDRKAGTMKLREELGLRRPRLTWVSMPCTRLTSLQNLTPRTELQWIAFRKRQLQDLKRSDEVATGVEDVISRGDDFAWEWPFRAHDGWNSKAIRRLKRCMQRHGRPLYWCRFDGCAYGLKYDGEHVMKQWMVATSSRSLWLHLCRRCSDDHEHRECRGPVAQASSYYPKQMVKEVVKAFREQWSHPSGSEAPLDQDVDCFLLQGSREDPDEKICPQPTSTTPQILALRRQRFPMELPTGKKLEQIKQQMLRVHRASGHASFQNLQRLLRARGAPDWAVTLAGSLQCKECQESKLPRPPPPASAGEEPRLFEILGTDVFDYVHEEKDVDQDLELKYKFILWKDRASGLMMVDLLKQFGGTTGISDWQPSTEDVVKSFTKWAMANPYPQWILADSATYFTSNAMLDFVSRSGIGLTIAPAESHWIMGSEESAIRVLKYTVDRLKKEHSTLDIPSLFQLAAGAHNSSIGPSGYSPFQWTRGGDSHLLPDGLDANKAFGGMLKLKDQARLAFEKEKAQMKYSKLNNATTRRPMSYVVGDLLMLWRQRPKPGKTAGNWVGPVRLLLQEGTTLWLATGSTLIRAKTNQVRPCSKAETLTASLEGTAVYSQPVSLDTLLKDFSGRNFWDVSQEVPSVAKQELNLQPTEVLARPDTKLQPDSWRLDDGGVNRLLVRVHTLPRLTLFSPDKANTCPVPREEFTGKRTTFIQPVQGGDHVVIHDDGEAKTLPYRWTGETHFELRPSKVRRRQPDQGQPQVQQDDQPSHQLQPSSLPSQPSSSPQTLQPQLQQDSQMETDGRRKRPLEESMDGQDRRPGEVKAPRSQDVDGTALPPETEKFTQILRERGPNVLDGIPAELQRPDPLQGASGSNSCAVPGCVLPGGHEGSHKNTKGDLYLYDPYHGRQWVTEERPDDDGLSESSSISEELIPDAPEDVPVPAESGDESLFYVFEMDVTPGDLEKMSRLGPHKTAIWLSKKMQEKSKEHSWSALPIDRKKDFDVAQAKELSNVMASKALRNLTASELKHLNPKTVMNMRWVLTTKSSGLAKARLVVLGFQAPNITEVETASPTLSKLSKHMILALAANLGYRIKSGDITSAFLQAKANLENDELTVWAPPELAVLYGAPPERPILPLRIVRAFYGLVQSPRLWFEDLQGTMLEQGWKQITADRCAFILQDGDEIVGLAGVHVDDYLIAGKEGNVVFEKAEKSLRDSYNFGKWESDSFEFAGTWLQQDPDGTIHLDQHEYVTKWLEEISLDKRRMSQKKSALTPAEISMVRAALGTLSWRATQSAPQFLADVSLLLSEVNRATIETVEKINKLVREVRRTSRQTLSFHPWRVQLQDLVVVVWADASNHNRPDKSSTMGLIGGLAPRGILNGEEEAVSIIQWKSSKTPRQCLGSNGAEVQSITIGEDLVFQLRALLAEFRGVPIKRYSLHKTIRDTTDGALVMDSRGIFDAATRNLSSLHGLRESRAGYELTLAVNQAKLTNTQLRWVNGLAQLGDSLTKWQARKAILQFFARGQRWRLVDDPMFVAGKKLGKRALERQVGDRQSKFLAWMKQMASDNHWPWTESLERSEMFGGCDFWDDMDDMYPKDP